MLVRAYGLTIDSLAEVEIVTADGQTRTASSTTDSDLFWACRGGGGGHLGVVTSLTFDTVAGAAGDDVRAELAVRERGRGDQGLAGVGADRGFPALVNPEAPGRTQVRFESGPYVSGTWLGAPADLNAQFAPFFAQAGAPASNLRGTHTYHDAMMRYAGCGAIPMRNARRRPADARA